MLAIGCHTSSFSKRAFLKFNLTHFLSKLARSAPKSSAAIAENSPSDIVTLPDISTLNKLRNTLNLVCNQTWGPDKTDLHDPTDAPDGEKTVKYAIGVPVSQLFCEWTSRRFQMLITMLNPGVGDARAPKRQAN